MKKRIVLMCVSCITFKIMCMQRTINHTNVTFNNYYMYQIKSDEIERIWEANQKETEIYFIKLKNNDLIKATKNNKNQCTCDIKPNGGTLKYVICSSTFYTVKQLYHQDMARIAKEQNRPIRYSSSDESNSTHEIADWTLIDPTPTNQTITKK